MIEQILNGKDARQALHEAVGLQEIAERLDDSAVSANGRDFRIKVQASSRRGKVKVTDLENLPVAVAKKALDEFTREIERRVEDEFGNEAEVTESSVTQPMMTAGDDIGNLTVTIEAT